MDRVIIRSVLLLSLITLSYYCLFNGSSNTELNPPPVCPGSGALPVMLGDTLLFCRHSGLSCCDAVEDAVLMQQFNAMNITDPSCAMAVRDKLCERCSPSLPTEKFKPADPVTTTRLLPDLLCTPWPSSNSRSDHHLQPGTSMCLQKVAAGSYYTMAAHPDGSGRAFFSTHDGKIWLASIPAQGHRATLRVVGDGANPFLDLSDRVHELKGVAFHPGFATNGRFFVSYSCDSSTSPTCGGSGRCYTSVARANGVLRRPCRFQLVVAEFSAQGGADYSKATRANPLEIRRIFTIGLPQLHTSYSYQQHGGQILFQPNDSEGQLYLISGYGSNDAHGQLGSSMNKRSLLGKIIRFYVDRPSTETEIFAMDVSNPSGCSFDSKRPSDLYCSAVDQHQYEKVYLISNKFGHNSTTSSSAKTISLVINHGRPAFGRMPSIVGGIMYRGSEDHSLKGRYLYMYASAAWVAVESRGRFVSVMIPSIRCSGTTHCHGGISGRVLSMGEDSSKNAFVLTTDGVYRIVRPGFCGAPLSPAQAQQTAGTAWLLCLLVFAVASSMYQVYMAMFAAGDEATVTQHNECCCSSITCWCCSSVTNYNGYNLPVEHEA